MSTPDEKKAEAAQLRIDAENLRLAYHQERSVLYAPHNERWARFPREHAAGMRRVYAAIMEQVQQRGGWKAVMGCTDPSGCEHHAHIFHEEMARQGVPSFPDLQNQLWLIMEQERILQTRYIARIRSMIERSRALDHEANDTVEIKNEFSDDEEEDWLGQA